MKKIRLDINKLNCNNYHVSDTDGEFWYAQNGLRSIYTYSKISNTPFKTICLELLNSGQIVVNDTRDNNNDTLCLTMI